ncbi:MAG: hypothetical protein NTY22_05030 [Proteobacteria bacterium]|nr:hypothetical protein [Pseudomonadota bacterium]
MNRNQKAILGLLANADGEKRTLQVIADKLGLGSPQAVKYHLEQLRKDGRIEIDPETGEIRKVSIESKKDGKDVLIPVLGAANCGAATLCAEERFEGFLRVSSSIVKKVKGIFAIKAVGDSMNKASIKNKNIEDGDYVLVDTSDKNIKDKDYVLSTIEGHANIKKFICDNENEQIVLISESDKNYPPIIIHKTDDYSYLVNGKVVQVVKVPK